MTVLADLSVGLEQAGDDWGSWRAGCLSASDAPVIAGCAPSWWGVKGWAGLRERDADEPSTFTKAARIHCSLMEKHVRRSFGGGPAMCVERRIDGLLYCASLDAVQETDRTWDEYKSPASGERSRLLRDLEELEPIPSYVWWQLVHQAGVIGFEDWICRLIVYVSDFRHMVVKIPSSFLLKDWPALRDQWQRFARGDDEVPGKLGRAA